MAKNLIVATFVCLFVLAGCGLQEGDIPCECGEAAADAGPVDDGGSDANVDADAATDVQPETDADVEPETDADVEPETDADVEPETDADAEPEPVCGNGECEAGENLQLCRVDCCTPGPVREILNEEGRTVGLAFNSSFISGSVCGEIRGEIPGTSWERGEAMYDGDPGLSSDNDGWLEWPRNPATVTPGTYRFSYVAQYSCWPDAASWRDGWAQYGSAINTICEQDLAWVFCEQDGCKLRAEFVAGGFIEPRGNVLVP